MNNIIFKTTFLKGEDGNDILRIDKTATSGLVDTYTITLTDGTTTTFNVTNGSSIATIEKTATVGMVDTYTITLTDGSTSTFEVTNGANVTIDDQLDDDSTNPVQNKVVTGAINGLSTAVGNISNNLNGFTYYPAGEVDLVASVSDDSYYTDANGKYVLADSHTGESLIDDITYKSLASNEDLRGEVGADTVSPFKRKTKSVTKQISVPPYSSADLTSKETVFSELEEIVGITKITGDGAHPSYHQSEFFSAESYSNIVKITVYRKQPSPTTPMVFNVTVAGY